MMFIWEPYVKDNHNTKCSRRLEEHVVDMIGAEKSGNSYDGKIGGIMIEVSGQHPGSSPNTKNRIDEKMGRVLRDMVDGVGEKFLVVFMAANEKEARVAVKHSRDTICLRWIIGTYDGDKYAFAFRDGSEATMTNEGLKCLFS